MSTAADWDFNALTFRQFLIYDLLARGSGIFMAIEAVVSTALAHPEWDMTEVKSLQEWEGGTIRARVVR